MFSLGLALSLIVCAGDAPAESASGTPVTLKQGERITHSVGHLRGVICDDLTIVSAELEDGTASNTLVLKGLKAGTTQCRVGTGRDGLFKLVRITVTRAP